MRIASYGDVHLSHSPVLDKFRGGEETLLRFDDHVSRHHDQVILMGDMFQTDYGRFPGSRADVFEAIACRFPRITARWRSGVHRALVGNHDAVTRTILGAEEEIRMTNGEIMLRFIHGHQFDPFIAGRGRMPSLVTWLVGGSRRIGLRRLADYVEGPLYWRCQRTFPRVDGAAMQMLIRGEADVVVMGHSHQVTCRSAGGGIYLNSGECDANWLRYLSIDTESRVAEIRAYAPSGDEAVLSRSVLLHDVPSSP